MKIVIIIPTYNEGQVIGSLIDAVNEELKTISQHNFSILVIDGKSKDNTAEVARLKGVEVIVEKEKSGLGGAYIKGMNYAIDILKADAFLEFDGDFQHNPKDIRKLIEKLDRGNDYIIGSRYIPGGTIPHEWPWYRKALSSGGNLIIKIGLGVSVHDATSGFKLTRVYPFKNSLPLKPGEVISLRHAYKINFLYAMIKAGAKTVEVPIQFLNRNKGISKSTFEDIIESLRVVWILGFQRRIFKNKNGIDKIATDSKKS